MPDLSIRMHTPSPTSFRCKRSDNSKTRAQIFKRTDCWRKSFCLRIKS